MLMVYGEVRQNRRQASLLYQQRFPERQQPSSKFFTRLAHRVKTTGNVQYSANKLNNAQDEDEVVDVLAAVTNFPQTSTRNIARDRGLSHMKVHRILKKYSFHPFHLSLHQALSEQDYANRVDFCQWALAKLQENDNFFDYVLWSDEATFKSDGNVNLHNLHYWSVENPHWMRVVDHQVRWALNVWCGILGNKIVGPYFFNGNLNGMMYRAFLQDILPQLMEDIPLATRRIMWYQQDGCPAHFSLPVRLVLNTLYPGRWIGRSGPRSWPARSPDLTPMDFYLWGRLKEIVYFERPTTVEEMQARIVQACAQITPEEIQNAQQGFKRRLTRCIHANGQQFEHL
jgi:hypothetical protein